MAFMVKLHENEQEISYHVYIKKLKISQSHRQYRLNLAKCTAAKEQERQGGRSNARV